MEFGKLLKDITQASNVQEAVLFVRRAADIEHELHCILCELCGNQPHGKRGYASLNTMAECVHALNSHAKKIEEYALSINSHEQGLKHFNQTIDRVQKAYDSVEHMLTAKQPHVTEVPRFKFPWWRRE